METLQAEQHRCEARLSSLQELQAAAEGRHDAAFAEWLADKGLQKAPRLAGLLAVDAGWERAVERALGVRLTAVCVDGLDRYVTDLNNGETPELALLDRQAAAAPRKHGTSAMLLDKAQSDVVITSYSIHYTKLYDVRVLAKVLAARLLVVVIMVAGLLAIVFGVFWSAKREYLPALDDGRISASITMDPGISVEEMDRVVKRLEQLAWAQGNVV